MNSPRRFGWLVSATALALAMAGSAAAQKTQLTVYTALETDQLKAYQEGFQKAVPDIEITWVRDSTGVITAKLLAEKSNPKADVVMGVAATSMGVFDQEGMLRAVRATGVCRVSRRSTATRRIRRRGSEWTCGARRSASTPSRRRKRNIPKPETWKDLTKPVYKGQIVMPHPASSGTGFFDVTAWLQMFGEVERLEVHGRPAREHRAVHALRIASVRSGRERRVRGRHLVRVPGEPREGARASRSTWCSRRKVSVGTWKRSGSTRARRTWRPRRSSLDWAVSRRGDGALREELRDRRACRRCRAAAAERSGRLRQAPREERLRLGREEPRQDPRRVVEALRVESGTEIA